MKLVVTLMIVELFSTAVQRILCDNTLSKKGNKARFDNAVWGGYYICANLLTYFVVDNVWFNMLITPLSFFLAIRLIYSNPIRTLTVTTVFIYLTGMGTEVFVLFVVEYFDLPLNDNVTVVYAIISRLICFCIVKTVSLIVKRKRNFELNVRDWLEVFMVPFGSIWIFLALVWVEPLSRQLINLIATSMVLTINIVTYYLYDKSRETVERRIREKMLEKQCEYYIRQYNESQKWWEELKKFRHDMKQHYLVEKMLLEAGNYRELERYCDENIGLAAKRNQISNTGNLYIDSILNYKAEAAEKLGIKFIVEAHAPSDGKLNAEDLCICLGNLLDNAIEATAGLTGEKIIKVKVSTDKENLFFNIVNPYECLKKENGKYLTNKEDDSNHGLGLIIVKQIVNKYKGQIEISDKNEMFDVAVLLFGFVH